MLTLPAYLIFFAWDIIGFITIWLFAVETKQLTLEEMEDIFTAPYPKKRSFELAKTARERAKREKEARMDRASEHLGEGQHVNMGPAVGV